MALRGSEAVLNCTGRKLGEYKLDSSRRYVYNAEYYMLE